MLFRLKITVAYDGTNLAGWQVQPRRRTVQGELERCIRKLTGENVRVHGSGRTDSGVHARRQVVHVDLKKKVETEKFVRGMNATLEPDIRILQGTKARSDFHARYDVKGKEYRYHIWNDAVVPPHLRFYYAAIARPLDLKAMEKAASQLQGRHDFSAFSANPGREVDGTVRTLSKLQVRSKGKEITIIAAGDGFLYKMVRGLAGFLIRVGTGELKPESAKAILRSKKRTERVPTAPAEGLTLWRVYY